MSGEKSYHIKLFGKIARGNVGKSNDVQKMKIGGTDVN